MVISLITPNYNGEKWLDECLESVADQTARQSEIEMILIDDGSTDGSRKIVENYSESIPGLKPIWHDHIGKPGALRNIAMTKAIGDYVLFLDSDDFLGTEAIERLSEFTTDKSSDVVAFQLAGLNRGVPTSMLRETIEDADVVSSGLYKTLGIWKMCRRDFLKEHGIRFDPTIGRGDDVTFFAEAMLRANKLSVIAGHPFYTVRGREDGSSITQKEWDHSQRLDVAKRVGELATSLARTDDVRHHFLIRIFNADVRSIIGSKNVTDETMRRIRSELGKYWSEEVAELIYTDDGRNQLRNFFSGELAFENA